MLVWGGAAAVKPMLDLLSASGPQVVVRGRAGGLGAFGSCSVGGIAAV
jgi:hypothetical protein